jgi:drug/metabolite transporter (DMT)-like permease
VSGQAANRVGVLAAILAALCWGASTVMSKAVLEKISPVSLLVMQLGASVIVLWLVVWIRRPAKGTWHEIARFAWLGLLEPGLAYFLGLMGLADTKAGGATLIHSSEAIMIVIISAILFREWPGLRFIVLSVFAFGGLLVALGYLNHEIGGSSLLGTSLIFCGTASAAFYVVLSGRIAMYADPIYIVAWQQTVALAFALVMLPVQWTVHTQTQTFPSTLSLWLMVALSGIVQFALAFSLYMKALSAVSANLAGSFLNLTPVFGLAGAFVFLREQFSILQMAGAALTIVSVTLISLGGEHSSKESALNVTG